MTGQVGRARGAAVPAVAVLLAAVLLSVVALAALRSHTAGAPTVLLEGPSVTAVLPDGTRRALVVGAEVPPGATVVAGPDGAVLRTHDRDVHAGGRRQMALIDYGDAFRQRAWRADIALRRTADGRMVSKR